MDYKKDSVTPPLISNSRRSFFKRGLYALSLTASMFYWPQLLKAQVVTVKSFITNKLKKLQRTVELDDKITKLDYTSRYNNFYELGTGKYDPQLKADSLVTEPWNVVVDGFCENGGEYSLQSLIKDIAIEERVYRFRCVEAWSAVIPWAGFSLSKLIEKLKPTQEAKFVAFESIYDRKNPLPGQKRFRSTIRWPYREGLRMDEAMHPLTLIAVGMYNVPLLNQNGAPIRLIVPWKYGFKSIKSIVKISFVDKIPKTTWNMQAPGEYGFYSNVNPFVSHPRWSQAKEKRLGEWLGKRSTEIFNGYSNEVAHLYKGMDLKKFY